MIPTQIDGVTEAHLLGMIDSQAEENLRLDFKAELPGSDRDAKKAFATDVCAMANAAGGDIVYGLAEDGSGRAAMLKPQYVDPDKETLRLTSLGADMIEPRLHGIRIEPVELAGGGYAFVVRVPRSATGIHRVTSSGQFYVRQSRSNLPLDVPGIVSRVSDVLGRIDRVDEFFAHRYATILSDQYPIPLRTGGKLVVHLVPLRDFLSGEHLDVLSLDINDVPYLQSLSGMDDCPCADGRVFWNGSRDGASTSTLITHSGVVEGLTNVDHSGCRTLRIGDVEGAVVRFVEQALGLRNIGEIVGWPMIVRVALVGTQGMTLNVGNEGYAPPVIRQVAAVLVMPETLIETKDVPVDATMHRAITRVWNAWGVASSPNYAKNPATGAWHLRR